jgi:hypothetical protein
MTRQEAIRTRRVKYDGTKRCPRGHLGQRYVRSGSCVQCHIGHYAKVHWSKHDRRAYQAAYYERKVGRTPERIFHQVAKARAKKYGIPFSITVADVRAVWPSDGRCPVLGIRLSRNVGRGPSANSPSLDRLFPERGYVPGNIAVISMRANLIKTSETDPSVFRKVADWLEKVQG